MKGGLHFHIASDNVLGRIGLGLMEGFVVTVTTNTWHMYVIPVYIILGLDLLM